MWFSLTQFVCLCFSFHFMCLTTVRGEDKLMKIRNNIIIQFLPNSHRQPAAGLRPVMMIAMISLLGCQVMTDELNMDQFAHLSDLCG